MRWLEQFAPQLQAFWLALLVVIQISTLIVAATLLARGFLRQHAAIRHSLWLCCLACVLLCPAVVVGLDRVGIALAIIPWGETVKPRVENAPIPVTDTSGAHTDDSRQRWHEFSADALGSEMRFEPEARSRARESSSAMAVDQFGDQYDGDRSTTRESSATLPSVADTDSLRLPAFLGALVLIWAIGIAIGLVRLFLSFSQLSRLRRSLEEFDVGMHGEVGKDVRLALGLQNLPPVYRSRVVSGPVAIGLIRACVVLPETLSRKLMPAQLRDVLVHECAHLVRRDPLVGLVQRLAGILYWPHPLIHFLNAQLARSCEEVCDNADIRSGDACGYARTLLQLSENKKPERWADVGLGLTDRRWTLGDRIAGLLDPSRDAATRARTPSAAGLALGLTAISVLLGTMRPIRANQGGHGVRGEAASSRSPERIARGIVVDESGQAVANATVFASRREKTAEPVTTSAHGSFRLSISGFMLVEEDLVASADGGRLMGLGKYVEARNSDLSTPVRIVLKPSRVTTVHVRDSKGERVSGATVAAVGFDYHGAATTDARGDASLRVPADAQVLWVISLKSGAGFDYFENYRSAPAVSGGPLPPDVSIRLSGARTVRIQAVDTAGKPVPGVEFEPWYIQLAGKLDSANIGGSSPAHSRTDSAGVATFDWLPTDIEESVPFLVYPGNYSCPARPVYKPGLDGAVIEARLLRNTRIKGVVRHRDGRPAAGILIRAEGRGATSNYCRMHTRTGDDGSYSLDVHPDQSYMIAVLDERWASKTQSGVVVREGVSMDGLNFTLGAGTLIHGRVTKSATGEPIAGEVITLIEQGQELPPALVEKPVGEATENLPQWASTDDLGRYHFRVGPGRFTLSSEQGKSAELLTVETQAEIPRDFRMTEASRWKELTGIAIEKTPAGERPIPEALIEAAPVERHFRSIQTVADAVGRFRISVPPVSKFLVYVCNPQGTVAGFTTLGAEAKEAKIGAVPASRIAGKVVDADGRPVRGRRVQLLLRSGPGVRTPGLFVRYASTDLAGRYEFRGIVVGAIAEIIVSLGDDPAVPGAVSVGKAEVPSPDPIAMRDITVPSAKGKAYKR
jgi:beta-lactamase regulating signal transducer with metallopeptidase domain